MPPGLCMTCTASAMEAGDFRLFCQRAASQWEKTLSLMEDFPTLNELPDYNKAVYFVMKDDALIIINDKYEPDYDVYDEPDIVTDISSVKTNSTKHTSKERRRRYSKNMYKLQCPDCEKTFDNPQRMYLHLEQSTDRRRACFLCAEVMNRDDLILHLINIHNTRSYPCQKCSAILQSENQLVSHMSKVHSAGSHGCGDCGRTFQSIYAMNAHAGVHTVKNCPSCDKVFRNQICYRHHVKRCCELDTEKNIMHKTKTKVTFEIKNAKSDKRVKVGLRGSANKECFCDYCGKKYSGKKYVAAHIQIVHMKNTHRPCSYCGKLYAAAHITEHVKKHEQIVSIKCEFCGLVLRSKLGYTQHIRLHTGERPYACKLCGATFSSSSSRSEHVRKVHRTSEIVLKHQCKYCPARFRLPYRLRKHISVAHSDEDDDQKPQFQCNVCMEKFGSCRGLVHHSKKHQQVPLNRVNFVESFQEAKVT